MSKVSASRVFLVLLAVAFVGFLDWLTPLGIGEMWFEIVQLVLVAGGLVVVQK